jgi:hypothetical protein
VGFLLYAAHVRQRAQTVGSPHGPWRLAHSPALQYAFPVAYLDALGLPRLLDDLA